MRVSIGILIATFCIVSLMGSANAKPKHSTQIKYYAVSGTSDRNILSKMNVGSQYFNHQQVFAYIVSEPVIDGQYFQTKKGCKLKNFKIRGKFVIHLPKLSSRAKIRKSTRRRFNGFFKFVKRHEYKHRAFYIGCYRRAERKIARIRSKSCSTLVSRAKSVLTMEGARCQRLNARFDAAERKRIPRQPLVKAALKQERSAKKRAVATRSTRRTRRTFNTTR